MKTTFLAWTYAIGFPLVLVVFSGCSGSMVSGSGKASNKETVTVDADQDSELTISSGTLGGTQIAIPAGALDSGSRISAAEVSAPAAFSSNSNVSSASSALSVSATGSDGSSLTQLAQPMTIQIPLGAAGLALAVEESEDNLCALLAGADQTNYVWRRSALAIVENKAVFDSTKLGTFQLVYCGAEPLDGFSDAQETNVAGAASTRLIKLTNVFQFASHLGTNKFCAGIYDGYGHNSATGAPDKADFLSFHDIPSDGTNAQTLELTMTPEKKLADIDSSGSYKVALFFQKATDLCKFDEGGSPDVAGFMVEIPISGDELGLDKDVDMNTLGLGIVQLQVDHNSLPLSADFTIPSCAESSDGNVLVKNNVKFGWTSNGGTVNGGAFDKILVVENAGTTGTTAEIRFDMDKECFGNSSNNPDHSVTAWVTTGAPATHTVPMYPTVFDLSQISDTSFDLYGYYSDSSQLLHAPNQQSSELLKTFLPDYIDAASMFDFSYSTSAPGTNPTPLIQDAPHSNTGIIALREDT